MQYIQTHWRVSQISLNITIIFIYYIACVDAVRHQLLDMDEKKKSLCLNVPV